MAKYTADHPKIKKIVKLMTKASDAYHNTDKPIMSDEKYDAYHRFVKKHVPDHPFLKRVGAPIKKGPKVRLPYFMPSLDKIYPDDGAQEFLDASSGIIDVLDKLDGTSALTEKTQKQVVKMFSRGNGSIGQDITKLLPHLRHVGRLARDEAVRGELVMSEESFQKYANEFQNARNLVSGVSNTQGEHKSLKDVDYVIHELVNPSTPWHLARVKLKSAGWTTVYTKRLKNPSVDDLVQHLALRRKQSPYKIDGLVLIDAKDGARISFKVNEPAKKAVVDHIEWNLSKHGIWKPVCIFKKAIPIGGVNVKRATIVNARRVVDWKVGPGAVVKLERAGDVIPKIVGVIKPAKPQLPDNYQWNAKKTDVIAASTTKKQQHKIDTKRLADSFKILEIDGVRAGVAQVLVKAKYDLIDVFHASKKEFLDLGIGTANSEKLYQGLRKVEKTVTQDKMMYASGIWPMGFTDTRFLKILTTITYSKMVKTSKSKLIQIIEEIHGFSNETAATFVNHLSDYIYFLEELGWEPKPIKAIRTDGKLSGMSFVFTRFRDKNVQNVLIENGGKVEGSIKSSTTYVVVKTLSATSTKLQKAKQLGVKVITINQLYKLLSDKGIKI